MLEASLNTHGYTIINFKDLEYLYLIQDMITSSFPCPPTEFHRESIDDDQRLALVKKIKDKIVENELVKKFLLANSEFLARLLGPDIDIQSDIYLRISRPQLESDFIDWHRDTFYGNSYWELNFWFPIFPLEKGAGLMIIDGSHLTPSHNIRSVDDQNSFRSQVTKGSLANELGYTYAPKSDDTISTCDTSQITLLTPQLGQGILFFAYAVHRAANASSNTRITADLRIKSTHAPTNTKSGYYQSLTKGVITRCVEKMILINS